MKEKLKAVDWYKVDWYKVAGLALLFWLCVSVNSLGDKVETLDASIDNKLFDVVEAMMDVGRWTHTVEVRNPLTVEVKNPTNAFGTTSFKVRTN